MSALNNIHTYLEINDINDINIYLIGGDGDIDLTFKIYLKLKLLGLDTRIMGTHLHYKKKYSKVSIDTRSGAITSAICHNYMKTLVDTKLNYHELELFYGFDRYTTNVVSWDIVPEDSLVEHRIVPANQGILDIVNSFPAEAKDNTFSTYVAGTDEQKKLLSLSKKFCNNVIKKTPKDGMSMFVINGEAGIGKTHMAVSVAKHASKLGINTIFLNAHTLGDIYQKSGVESDYFKWIHGYDLYVIDDMNSDYGVASSYLEKLLVYAIFFSKSIMITSNVNLEIFYKKLPEGFDTRNIVVHGLKIGTSLRVAWTDSAIGIDKLDQLISFDGNQAAGLVVEDRTEILFGDEPEHNTEKYVEYVDRMYANKNNILKNITKRLIDKVDSNFSIKIVGNSSKLVQNKYGYYGHVIADAYVHGIESVDYAIIYVSEKVHYSIDQLIHLIQKAHDARIKFIVVTDNIESLSTLFNYNYKYKANEKKRVVDRTRIALPGVINVD